MNPLYRITGFMPFVAMIFLNAFVDLGHKIIIQNAVFKIHDGPTQVILTAIVNALILIPYILLFTPSGYLADRFRKPSVMRLSAAAAVLLTLLITLCYHQGWFWAAFAMTFLLAVQSAFYSPAKYGYIREIAGKDCLAAANGVVQATTIVAILCGVFVYSILFEHFLRGHAFSNEDELIRWIAPVGWILVGCTLAELYMAFRLPTLHQPGKMPALDWRTYLRGGYLIHNLRILRRDRTIWLAILGLAVFWAVSQVVLAAFPAFAKEHLAIDNTVLVQGLLACSGIGIVIGSLLAGRVSDRYIETGLIPLGALGMVVTLGLLPRIGSLPLLGLDIGAFGLFGGMFIVPLNALIQFHARESQLGTVLAGNNWMQNIVMLAFLGLTVAFALVGASSALLLKLLVLVTLAGALFTVWKLPQSLVRYIAGLLFGSQYRIRVIGFHNIPSQGGVLLLGNHISWLDWAMIQIACPRPVHFVMHRKIYERWYLKWFLDLFGTIPIARGQSRAALAHIRDLLNAGGVVCLFPEGAISRNGQLGPFKHGFERAAKGADAVILPFYLRGLWGSSFSRSSQWMKARPHAGLRRDVIVAFGPPLPIESNAAEVKAAVFELSIDAWRAYVNTLPPVPLAWLQTACHRPGQMAIGDSNSRVWLNRRQAAAAVIRLARHIPANASIGLLLPTSRLGLLMNLAVLLRGGRIVNLEPRLPIDALRAAIASAGIERLCCSRAYIERLARDGHDLQALLAETDTCFIDTADSAPSWLTTLWARVLPASWLYRLFGRPVTLDATAAIVFEGGDRDNPRGILLSQRNIIANIRQIVEVLDARVDDVMLASLPLSQALGLTVTGLLPLVEGIPLVCHPDPNDARGIARAVARNSVTLLVATPACLRQCVEDDGIHPLMLESLRLVVSGRDKLDADLLEAFRLKFGKRIYIGYGVAETTPVASVNIPDRIALDDWHIQTGDKAGSVGMPLPGSSIRIVDPETLEPLPVGENGLILIGGEQVMQGYLNDAAASREAILERDGKRWFRTGQSGHLDEDGFLTLVDRRA